MNFNIIHIYDYLLNTLAKKLNLYLMKMKKKKIPLTKQKIKLKKYLKKIFFLIGIQNKMKLRKILILVGLNKEKII